MSNGNTNEDLSTVSEKVARAFGVAFILIGLFLIIYLVGGFIISKLPYRVDPNLPIPTLRDTDAYTNKDSIDVAGTVLPGEEVVLYIDEDRVKETVVTDEDGSFVFENITLDEEGDTSFEAAVVRGGLFKRRSEFSNTLALNVDWTPPSTSISFEYETETNSDETTVRGTAEPNSIVVLENDRQDTYEIEVDENGDFELTQLPLSDGLNTYSVRIKDKAGNEVLASDTVEIVYAMAANGGDVNGDAVSIGPNGGKLPESAGELEAAMEFLAGNSLMLVMSLIALAVFGSSSALAYRQARKEA